MSALLILEDDVDGWLVLAVEGDVDLHTGARLRARLADALTELEGQAVGDGSGGGARGPAHRGLVVDLSEVDFMDSAGLGVLVAAHKRARASGVAYRLAGARSRVTTLFTVSGLLRVMVLHPSVAAATAAP